MRLVEHTVQPRRWNNILTLGTVEDVASGPTTLYGVYISCAVATFTGIVYDSLTASGTELLRLHNSQ